MKRGVLLLAIFAMLGTTSFAWTIQGKIVDREGRGKSGIKVQVRGDLGLVQNSFSLQDGTFRFAEVPEGWYFIRLENLENYTITSPTCGWYYEYIEGDSSYDFTIEATGVSVDFGKPGGGLGGGGIAKRMSFQSTGNTFSLSLFTTGMNSFGFNYPTHMEVEGSWYSLGTGPLDVDVLSGVPAPPYAATDLEVGYNVDPSNSIKLTMSLDTFPYLTIDGEVATFVFQPTPWARALIAANGDDACFCIDHIAIWSGETLLYYMPGQWCDTLEFNGR